MARLGLCGVGALIVLLSRSLAVRVLHSPFVWSGSGFLFGRFPDKEASHG